MSKKHRHKDYQIGTGQPVAESPQEERKIKVIFDEVSISGSAFYKTGIGQPDYNPDDLVGKKGLQIYAQMAKDDQVKAVSTMKKMAMLSTGWDIYSASDDPDDIERKEFVKWNLDNLEGTLEDYLYNILTAHDFGFSLSELNWYRIEKGRWAGKVGLKSIKTREPFYYIFDSDVHGNLRDDGIVFTGSLAMTKLPESIQELQTGKMMGVRFPVNKFIIYSYNMKFSNHFGESDFRAAYRSFFSKEILIRFHNIYMERFGMPTHVGTVPRGTSKADRDDLRTVLDRVQAKYSIVIPEDMKIDLLRAESGGAQGFMEAIEMHNKFIARSMLVPDLMGYTRMEGGGAYALGKKHFDNFLWGIKKGHRDIEESIIGEQLIKRLIDYNWADVEEYPKFKFESVTEEGSQAKAGVLAISIQNGMVNPKERWVRDYLGLPAEDKKAPPMVQVPVQIPQEIQNRITALEEKITVLKSRLPIDIIDVKLKKKTTEASKFAERKVKPTRFDIRRNYAEVKRSLDDYQDDSVAELSEIVQRMRDEMVRFVRRRKLIENKDAAGINKLQVKYVGDFRRELLKRIIKLYVDGKLEAAKMLALGGVKVDVATKFQAIGDWEPVPPEDAMDFFRKKILTTVTTKEGEKMMVDMLTGAVLDYYNNKAFYVAGVEKEEILKQVKASLLNSLAEGHSVDTAISGLMRTFDKYMETGEINEDDELVTAHRLETIVRTNFSEAFNSGLKDFVDENEITDFVPYMMWTSILDSRVRLTHAQMHSKIFREDDPALDLAGPPAGFNCRCFPYDVFITTSKGKRWIRDIEIGDLVWTHRGRYKKVTKVHSRKYKGNLVKINYGFYNELSMTSEHPVYIWYKGWIEAKMLKFGDWIKGGKKRKYRIIRIERIPFEGMVYNLSVEEDESYIANGIVVHNCSLLPITQFDVEDEVKAGRGIKVSTEADLPPDFPDPGFKRFSEQKDYQNKEIASPVKVASPEVDEDGNEADGDHKDFIRWDPNSSELIGHYRLINPASFKSDSITTWDSWAGIETEGVRFVVGDLKDTGEKAVQAVRFDKDKWTEDKATEWWDMHKSKFKKTWMQADWEKTT